MSLRRLTFLLVVLVTAGLSGVILINVTGILSNHFTSQEKFNMYLSIKQVENALNQQLSFLDKTSNDWGNSDLTYNFSVNRDQQYIAENLQPANYKNLGFDMVIILDGETEVLYNGFIENGLLINNIPPDLTGHLKSGDLLLSKPDQSALKHGLYKIDDLPMMIVSHPILKTDGSGPSRGTLLIGKYLDKSIIDDIGNLLLLSVDILSTKNSQNDPVLTRVLSYKPTDSDPFFVDLTKEQVSGYSILNDIYDMPAFFLRITRFPNYYNNGILVNDYLMTVIALISGISALILFFLIEFIVLNRVRQLSNDVQAVGISGNLNSRLPIRRKDELATLAMKINDMLGALDQVNTQKRESEDRFRTLVESMEDVVFTVDRENRQIKIYDKKISADTMPPSEKPIEMTAVLQQDLNNQLSSHDELINRSFLGESTTFEWTTQSFNKDRVLITTLSPIYNDQKSIVSIVGVSKDITSQKKLEQDLRNRILELRALLNSSQELMNLVENEAIQNDICELAIAQIGMNVAAVFVASPDGSNLIPTALQGIESGTLSEIQLYPKEDHTVHPIAVAYNEMAMKLYPEDLITSQKLELGPERYSTAVIPLIYRETVLAVLVLVKNEEPFITDESLPMIHAFVNLCSVAMQNAYLFRQILNGRARLQDVSRRLIEAQEEERRKIALELHDEIGQLLTGLRLSVDMINTLHPDKIKNQVSSSINIINEMTGRIRQMSLDLRPSMLDDLGIIPTLIWYLDRYTAQTGIHINFQHNNILDHRFSPSVEITMFRIIQEALTNVARYANVSSANVRLWNTEEIIGIQVEDAGVGFEIDEVLSSHKSKGLAGIRERLSFLGGQMFIVSQPGEGTCLTAEIPSGKLLERRKHGR